MRCTFSVKSATNPKTTLSQNSNARCTFEGHSYNHDLYVAMVHKAAEVKILIPNCARID
jgi:hypothetical protein